MKIFGLIITTKNKLNKLTDESYFDGMKDGGEIDARSTWTAINPVIHDLEKLRANTWDQDKITHIQNWLRHNFEVK